MTDDLHFLHHDHLRHRAIELAAPLVIEPDDFVREIDQFMMNYVGRRAFQGAAGNTVARQRDRFQKVRKTSEKLLDLLGQNGPLAGCDAIAS